MNIISLGQFIPSSSERPNLIRQLGEFLKERVTDLPDLRWHVRIFPESIEESALEWHQDFGCGPTVIFWSNIYPTRFRDIQTREEYVSSPNEVLIMDNRTTEHCAPPEYKAEERVFIRAECRANVKIGGSP